MRVLDLFSGIGGFSLGLERAGMRTVAFCEIDPYCRAVLRKHWPAVPCFEDVRDLHAFDVGPIDLICGGFPCQDISDAGDKIGITGARSSLWHEYRRLIGEIRPAWAVIENVSVLRHRGLEVVLGGLAALGYDAEWHCVPACAIGAPHRRDRIWIVAYSNSERQPRGAQQDLGPVKSKLEASLRDNLVRFRAAMADPDGEGRAQPIGPGEAVSRAGPGEPSGQAGGGWYPWIAEPDVGRVANGVPSRVDRLRALGNAVVPQIPEIIGRAIMSVQGLPSTRVAR